MDIFTRRTCYISLRKSNCNMSHFKQVRFKFIDKLFDKYLNSSSFYEGINHVLQCKLTLISDISNIMLFIFNSLVVTVVFLEYCL